MWNPDSKTVLEYLTWDDQNSGLKLQCFIRVPGGFFGIQDFPYLKLGIWDFMAKSSRRDSGLNVCARGGMPKITIGITGLLQILGQDYGIEERYWGPSSTR